jgi:hypothetical protein
MLLRFFCYFEWNKGGTWGEKMGRTGGMSADISGKFVQKKKCFVQKIKKRPDVFWKTCGKPEIYLSVCLGK